MKRNILFILALHIVVSLQAAIGLTKLTVEGRTEPLGFDVTAPRFGWQIVSDKKNVMQEGYQLQVSTAPRENSNIWDSGYVPSDSSQWVSYKGCTLKPLTKTYIITVYATKDGYYKSDVVSASIQWKEGRPKYTGFISVKEDKKAYSDLNGDGNVDVGDIMAIINIMAQ